MTATRTPDGENLYIGNTSDFYIDDLGIFTEPQHDGNFIPRDLALEGTERDLIVYASYNVSTSLSTGEDLNPIDIYPDNSEYAFDLYLDEIFNKTVEIFGVMTPFRNVLIIITTVILLVAMVLIMRFTPLGIAMRAASENFTTARLMGVPANLVISCAFVISGFLAAVVAIFWTARTGSVEPLMGASPLNVAFIAVVIGGMNSLPGAVLGGYIYALIANILSLTLPSGLLSFRDAIMFVIVIAFLILKPEGLLRGNYQEERVG